MNILLVRPDGIGDQILCLPVASAIRRAMPEARLSFLSSAYAAPLFDYHPDLDAVLTVSGQERFGELVALFRKGIDAAVFLKPFRRLMAAAWIARVPLRVATGYRWYSMLANKRVYQHRSDFSKHETEYNLGLLSGLGIDPGVPVRPALVVTQAESESAEKRLHALPPSRIVLHPGGFAARRWRSEHYMHLANHLVRGGFGVIFTGNTAEGGRFQEETAHVDMSPGMLNLMGALTVRELMAVIGNSHAVISGATGPAHIAAALEVPTVSLFDPRRNNLPTRWQPMGKGIVLRPDVPTCEKCVYEACPYWDCLDRVTVDEVARRVKDVMNAVERMTVCHV
jgi:heptosyltransferase-2